MNPSPPADAGTPLLPGQVRARIAGIATHVPDRVLGNDELAALFPEWPARKIYDKTGIRERRIAAPDETAADLAFAAAEKMLARDPALRDEVDFLILCTQAPDYVLPTTACVLQSRLGLRTGIGALDVNLGCSGFVYCLSLAAGLIALGAAKSVLLLTADTYSKYIHELDKSVRTLFGDGAAATLIRAADEAEGGQLGPFLFGTDGRGARDLIVETGGFRTARSAETAVEKADRSGNTRAPDNLYMDGARVMSFTLREVPRIYRNLLEATGSSEQDIDQVVLHQANRFMLDALQQKLALPDDKVPRHFENIGNTVSSTIPFVLARMADDGRLAPGARFVLIGFGVGLSWAAATVTF
jgi:3-oxoacyl-[acyl-carrier-protein] synthase-3